MAGPPEFALPRGGRPRRPWRLPVLAGLAAAVTLGGGLVVKARLERDPLEGVPAAARAEMAVRAAEASGDPAVVERSLLEALAYLEEARQGAPGDVTLARGRLAVFDRLGGNATRHGAEADALRYTRHAAEEALAILQAEPADERAILDALATANTHADCAEKARVAAVDRRRVLLAAALAARQGTPGSAAALARTWMRVAQLSAGPDAAAAWERAAAVAEEGPASPEAVSVLGSAAVAAMDRGELPLATRLDARAVARALAVVALRPADPAAKRLLENRLVAAAERAGEGALPMLERVVALRRERLASSPGDAETRRELARALSNVGAWRSAHEALQPAFLAYAEAEKLALGLTGEGRRTHLVVLGNLSQILGKMSRWEDAREAAARAVELATELEKDLDAGDDDALDLASAQLRYARLLRAPGGDRARAAALARSALGALDARFPASSKPDARRAELRTGLTDLLGEGR